MRPGSMAALVASACLAAGALALPAAASTTTTGPGRILLRPPAAGGHRMLPLAALLRRPGSVQGAITTRGVRQGQTGPGTVTGVVRARSGQLLAGVCVTAAGASGAGATHTNADGRFTIAGLRAGRYTLEIRDCAAPGRYWPQWSGGAVAPALASPVRVRAAAVTRVAPVTMRPASRAAILAPPSAAQVTRMAGGSAAASKLGGISGRLTGPHGQPAGNTCVEIDGGGFSVGVFTGSKGAYSTGRELPAGRYTVVFAPLDCGPNPGNWAREWYKNKSSQKTATAVRITAGKVTRNISGRLRHGSIINGAVTSRAGTKLSRGCVVLVSLSGLGLGQAFYSHGRYSLRGLPAGRYHVLFEPACISDSRYLPQWWRDKQSFAHADTIRVRPHATISGISARLVAGGTITGTVRFRTASGPGLSGICVDATTGSGLSGPVFFAATGKGGRYRILGVPPGTYSVDFAPGCDNNGNYMESSFPHPVRVTDGKTTGGIDGVLQPGGVITGKVTDSRGRPLRGITVAAFDSNDDGGTSCTGPAGGFRIGQLPRGRYTVEFVHTSLCRAKGSWAPQFYPGATDPDAADPVPVAPGQHVSGINATMRPGAIISGAVTSRAGKSASKICAVAQSVTDAISNIESGGPFGGNVGETGTGGRYRIADLPAGRYAVQFIECGSPAFANRWFSGRPGVAIGDIVDVGPGAVVGGVGAVMAPGGAILSRIRNRAGKPVSSACEVITNLKTGQLTSTSNVIPGSGYRIAGLARGRYQVYFYTCLLGAPYATQWYNRKPSPRTANTVRVTGRHVTGGVNAALDKGGSIAGQLTSRATARPLRNFCVTAVSRNGLFFGLGTTHGNGRYRITGLNTANYQISFFNCNDSTATIAQGQLARTIHVTAPRAVTGVNIAATAGGSISGRVLAGHPAAGEDNVCVAAIAARPGLISGLAFTGRGGRYRLTNLQPGPYKIHFMTRGACDDSRDGLVPQWYKGAGSPAAATTVVVRAGRDEGGIDATLQTDGGISGRVTAAATGAPVTGACVRVIPLAAGQAASFTATGTGRYAITGLPAGRYKVKFSSGCGVAGFATQWWHDKPSAALATVITIKAGAVTTGINAALRR